MPRGCTCGCWPATRSCRWERAADLGVEKVPIDDLLARADFISLHAPLTDQTRGILDAAALARTRRGVRIVNCARGGLIVERDLGAALESGHVAGAALDVFAEEPASDNPLLALPEVVATPHLGAATAEAQENVAVQIAEQMSDFLNHGAVANALNMPSLSAEDAPRLRPYLHLAELLGSFAGQIAETGPASVRITFEGRVAALNMRPLSAVVLAGLLSPLLETVNMVNAPVVARERDIDVTESRNERADGYISRIRLTVADGAWSWSVAGTLLGEAKPRIVEVDGIDIEAELGPPHGVPHQRGPAGVCRQPRRHPRRRRCQHRDAPPGPQGGRGKGRDPGGGGRAGVRRSHGGTAAAAVGAAGLCAAVPAAGVRRRTLRGWGRGQAMTDAGQKALLPHGLRDTLDPEASHEAHLAARMMSVFAAHGYDRVRPPLVEFEDSLLEGPGGAVAAQMFRLVDPLSPPNDGDPP